VLNIVNHGQTGMGGVEKMSLPLLGILTICTIQIIGILWITIMYRKHLSTMHGMISSMALGMMGGIFYGLIIGLFLHGNLYTSSLLSIVIGLTIGFLAGLPFGLVAILDGSVSGLMGGMMGAMLGEMIPMSNPDFMVKILAYFFIMLLLLVFYLLESSIANKSEKALSHVKKYPYLTIFIITILFYFLKHIEVVKLSH
jgi:hypothetical protein